MIIHHKNISNDFVLGHKQKLKYSEEYSFIPLRIKNKDKFQKCIFETPELFIPYAIQTLDNMKQVLDLSFQNIENNDNNIFLEYLKIIYYSIKKKFNKYKVNNFIKKTQHDYCIRFKLSKDIVLYDSLKNKIKKLESYTYGKFIIYLKGLWIKDNEIWFQWILLQGKSENISPFKEYLFSDEETDCKYNKMLKMGVPKEAVELKKRMDLGAPPPPPPPPPLPNLNNKYTFSIPKIKASDLQNVKLKKTKPSNNKLKQKLKSNTFEPPSLEELQLSISKLKKI